MVHGTSHVNSQINFAVGMTKCLGSVVKELTTDSTDPCIRSSALRLGSKYIIEDNEPGTVLRRRKSSFERNDPYYHHLSQAMQAKRLF